MVGKTQSSLDMAIKTFSAELPKQLIPFAIAYSKKQFTDQYKILEIVESDSSKVKKNQAVQANGYNKRQANSLLIDIEGKRDSALQCRENHIETLEAKIESALRQIRKWEKQLESFEFPCCDIRRNQFKTVQHRLRFKIHNKKRYVACLQQRLEKILDSPVEVNLGTPKNFVFVGSCMRI